MERVCEKTPEPWLVLFDWRDSTRIDPFREEPGYGPLIDQLYAGQQSEQTVLAATLEDGLVYRINCQQDARKNTDPLQ